MKSLVYYLAKINENYPEIEQLTVKDYNELSGQIEKDIENGVQNSAAVDKLIKRSYQYFRYLAQKYVDLNLSNYDFDDYLSYFYLRIIKSVKKRYNDGNWFKNYKAYERYLYTNVRYTLNKLQKRANEPKAKRFDENSLNELAVSQFEELLKEINQKELSIIIKEFINHLTPRTRDMVYDYYGLNCPRLTPAEIAEKYHCSAKSVHTLVYDALKRLKWQNYNKALLNLGLSCRDFLD